MDVLNVVRSETRPSTHNTSCTIAVLRGVRHYPESRRAAGALQLHEGWRSDLWRWRGRRLKRPRINIGRNLPVPAAASCRRAIATSDTHKVGRIRYTNCDKDRGGEPERFHHRRSHTQLAADSCTHSNCGCRIHTNGRTRCAMSRTMRRKLRLLRRVKALRQTEAGRISA